MKHYALFVWRISASDGQFFHTSTLMSSSQYPRRVEKHNPLVDSPLLSYPVVASCKHRKRSKGERKRETHGKARKIGVKKRQNPNNIEKTTKSYINRETQRTHNMFTLTKQAGW